MDNLLTSTLLSIEQLQDPSSSDVRSLYKQVQNFRQSRILNVNGKTDEASKLSYLSEEIQLRTKITQQEIYFIGEMLVQAREIINSNKMDFTFQEWVEKNFSFSYHTALNFCKVYTACMGKLEHILYVKPSVLYTISSNQFPEDLRDVLIFSDILPKLKNKEVKEIYEDFQTNGFDSVQQKLEKKSGCNLKAVRMCSIYDKLKIIYDQIVVTYNTLNNDFSTEYRSGNKSNLNESNSSNAASPDEEILSLTFDSLNQYHQHLGKVLGRIRHLTEEIKSS